MKMNIIFKSAVAGIVLAVVTQSYGQGFPRRGRGATSFQERTFYAHYPTGTNDLGRSYRQQADFDRDFALSNFLGWTFGDKLDGCQTKKLAKPFRLFDSARLEPSARKRLCEIELEVEATDFSVESVSNELVKLSTILHKQFGFSIYAPRWDPGVLWMGKHLESQFQNETTLVWVHGFYSERGDSKIKLGVRNRAIVEGDRVINEKIKKEEERLAREKREKVVSVADNTGAEMLISKQPNVLLEKKEKKTKSGSSFGEVGPEELLEPILPLEEAVKLAKKNDPRGYYQMAIIISRRKNWRDKNFDADLYAKECWQRAVSAGYKNALAIDALLKDCGLHDECAPMMCFSSELTRPSQLAKKYGGAYIHSGCVVGSLASPEDVEDQRRRYEEVIKMGYPQMTNALAFLEWRVARVAAKKAKEAAAKADSDELAELVKSVITLPKKETQKERSAKIAAKAKDSGSVYLRTTGEETMATGWDDKQGKPLVVEFLDACEGYTRELYFSADGKLQSVSPATLD